MSTTVFAATRLILFGFGWAIAGALALLADMMLPGMKWPAFALIAGWWTFACAVYVQGEAVAPLQAEKSQGRFPQDAARDASHAR